MVNTHDAPFAINVSAPSSHRVIEVLGRLQAQTTHTVSSSVYIYDLVDQCTLCATSSLAAMLGYTADEIHNMGAMGMASLIHPVDLNRVSDHYLRFTTLTDGDVIAVEYRMKRADGDWCWLRSQETLLVQAIDGFPLQVLGLVQDITPLLTVNSGRPMTSDRSPDFFEPHLSTQTRIRISTLRRQ
jgi:PAS domain S-box-containing protein